MAERRECGEQEIKGANAASRIGSEEGSGAAATSDGRQQSPFPQGSIIIHGPRFVV